MELAHLIREQLEEYEIDSKFICTDGVANMARCSMEAGLQQIKCSLHGINLAVKDVLYLKIPFEPENDDDELVFDDFAVDTPYITIIDEVRSIAKFFKRSGLVLDVLRKCCLDLEIRFVVLGLIA